MENFIEIDENTVIYFDDWIYDAIINKLFKYIEDKEDFKFYDLIFNSKRENSSFLSLNDLSIEDFHYFFNLLKNSANNNKSFFIKEKQRQLKKKYNELLNSFYKDKRFYEKY